MDEEEKSVENAIFESLEKLRQEAFADEEEDDPDELVKELPSIKQPSPSDNTQVFDFVAHRSFFDEIYFKHSRLIKQ